jgi:hypothetical protein
MQPIRNSPTRLRDREGPPQQKQLSFLAEVG